MTWSHAWCSVCTVHVHAPQSSTNLEQRQRPQTDVVSDQAQQKLLQAQALVLALVLVPRVLVLVLALALALVLVRRVRRVQQLLWVAMRLLHRRRPKPTSEKEALRLWHATTKGH